ncbi:MAG: hypothetical protein HY023_01355 [Chloroflexi bacterium]|nr:hypothetical protein [Chloroflexota bacterium]
MTELEDLLAEVLRLQARTQLQVEQTSREMRASRERSEAEMRDFKAEMRASRERSEAEMRDFKAEMRASRERSEAERHDFKIENNKRWGELANKLGTLAEDIVAPSVPRILRDVVQCPEDEIDFMAVRVRRRHTSDSGRSQEFDVVAICGEHVLLNETRTRLKPGDVDEFVETLSKAREFFPEYDDKKIIGAIASLYVDETVVRHGEKQGVLVLGLGEDLMDVLNAPGFAPRVF